MNIYEKALKKIEHDQKCKEMLIYRGGMIGPTGATGPEGPIPNLSIGSVSTGAPGTNAEVKITKV